MLALGPIESRFSPTRCSPPSDAKQLAQLAGAIADGKLAIPIARRFPLREAAEAQKLAERGASGKVLLTG